MSSFLKNIFLPGLLLILIAMSACSDPVAYPRPLAFSRIDFPQNPDYKTFDSESCPFTFKYPSEAEISRNASDSCWVDIKFPAYDCKWHVTYRDTRTETKEKEVYYEEWRNMIFKHSKKATRIQDKPISSPDGKGFMYEVYGNVGTPAQLFFSDTKGEEIVMLSCYFRTATKNDSLAPVIDYMKVELEKMVQTLKWE